LTNSTPPGDQEREGVSAGLVRRCLAQILSVGRRAIFAPGPAKRLTRCNFLPLAGTPAQINRFNGLWRGRASTQSAPSQWWFATRCRPRRQAPSLRRLHYGHGHCIIAALSQTFFAIAIEFGSGVGFWLVFGHAAPVWRRETDLPSTEVATVDPSPPQKLYPIDEKPGDIVERFLLDVVRPLLNARVRSLAMWKAYVRWCAVRNLDAVSHAMFGRLARWRKDRIGGAVWYLDCELAEGYADLAPHRAREPKAFPRPRPSLIAKGAQTTH